MTARRPGDVPVAALDRPQPAGPPVHERVDAGVPPVGAGPAAEQALIEEARRRQRRRRRWTAGGVAVVLVGAGLGLGLGLGGGGRSAASGHPLAPPPSPFAAPSSAAPSPGALRRPEALAVAADGGLLIVNQGTDQILRRSATGVLTVVAGTGKAGFGGDGGPARDAVLNDPTGLTVSPNGTIYVADSGNNRVRAISPTGGISTVAGNGRPGPAAGNSPAASGAVPYPTAVAVGAGGRLYIVDAAGVQVLSSDGMLTTLIPAGPRAISVRGAPTAFVPDAIAVDRAGDLYVGDFSPKLLIEFTPTGRVVDSWQAYVSQAGLTADPDGSILVADYGQFGVDRISDERLTAVATFTRNTFPGLTGTLRPSGVAVSATGKIYTDTDGVNGGTSQPALATIATGGQPALLPPETSTR